MRNVVLNDDYTMIMVQPKSNGANKMYLQISDVGGGGGVVYSLNLLCIIIIIYWNGYKFAPIIVCIRGTYTVLCSQTPGITASHLRLSTKLSSHHQPTDGNDNQNTHNRIQTCTRSRYTRNVCEVFSLSFSFYFIMSSIGALFTCHIEWMRVRM